MLCRFCTLLCRNRHINRSPLVQSPQESRAINRIILLVLPGFSSLALTAITTVLRLANRELGKGAFEWIIASPSGGEVQSSDALSIRTIRIDETPSATSVFLIAAYRPLALVDADLLAWIRRQARSGVFLAGIESGTFLLAEAGLMQDHEPALHPEDRSAFAERWPGIRLSRSMLNLGDSLATVGGVTATLDFALGFIERARGQAVTRQIAQILAHRWRPDGATEQQSSGAAGDIDEPPVMRRCKALMLENLQEPLPIATLCQRLGISQQRLRRLFNKSLGVTPSQYYKAVRLTEARFILINSDQSVTEVGLACGFTNASAFARAFKAQFGFPPSSKRDPYMGLGPSPFWPEATPQ